MVPEPVDIAHRGLRTRDRRVALGGIVGPVGFVLAWALTGAVSSGYSPLHDAISRLAAVHASTRAAMTAGFVVFGVGVSLYARALRVNVDGWAWVAALVSALATLGVALVPLDQSATSDVVHGMLAGLGYVAIAATPILAAGSLRRGGRDAWARASVLTGVAAGLCLALTTAGPFHGLFQRLGLTIADAWIVATSVGIHGGRFARRDG